MIALESVLNQLILVMLVASAALWFFALKRLWAGQPLVDLEPPRAVSWGLIDLVIAFFLLFLITGVFLWLGHFFLGLPLPKAPEEVSPGDQTAALEISPGERAGAMLLGSLATLAAMGLSWGFIVLRTTAKLEDLTCALRSAPADILLGVKAFLMLAPPVFAMQGLLTHFFEYKHPLIDLIMENPDPLFFWMLGFSAVIAAPLAEEYLFRLLLQGWFEKLTLARGNATRLLFGDNKVLEIDPEQNLKENQIESLATAQLPYWPIFLGSTFFVIPHLPYGPASAAPLFVLAIGLGYLYRQTRRMTASITVHALLNGFSTAMLIYEVYGKPS